MRPTLDPARVPRPLRSVVEIGRAMVHEWQHDRVGGLAAEMAFYSILSVFPGLLALAALLGLIDPIFGADVAADVEAEVIDAIATTLDLRSDSATLRTVRDLFDQSSTGLLTFGLLAAIWAVSRGFASLIKALDIAYDLEEHRPWLRLRLTALGLAVSSLLVGTIVLTMTVVGPLLGAGHEVADVVGLGSMFATFWDWFRLPTVFVIMLAWMATVYHVAPNHRTPWRADLTGAVTASLLVLAVSGGFRAYLEVSGGSNEVFGVLGSAISLLLWLYLMSLSMLVGGELNAILWARRREDPAEVPPEEAGGKDGQK